MLFTALITAIMASTLPFLANALQTCIEEDETRCSGLNVMVSFHQLLK